MFSYPIMLKCCLVAKSSWRSHTIFVLVQFERPALRNTFRCRCFSKPKNKICITNSPVLWTTIDGYSFFVWTILVKQTCPNYGRLVCWMKLEKFKNTNQVHPQMLFNIWFNCKIMPCSCKIIQIKLVRKSLVSAWA